MIFDIFRSPLLFSIIIPKVYSFTIPIFSSLVASLKFLLPFMKLTLCNYSSTPYTPTLDLEVPTKHY